MKHTPVAVDANFLFEDPHMNLTVKDLAKLAHQALRVVSARIKDIKLVIDSTNDVGHQARLTIEQPSGDNNVIAYEIAFVADSPKGHCIGGAFSLTHHVDKHSWMFPCPTVTDQPDQEAAFLATVALFTRLIETATQFLALAAPIPHGVHTHHHHVNGSGYVRK